MLIIFCLLIIFTAASGQEDNSVNFALGYQVIQPIYGISGILFITDPLSVQAVVWMDDDPLLGFDVRYAFLEKDYIDFFAYGIIGSEDEDLGLGFGMGLEWDWRSVDTGLPPLLWNAEVGLFRDDVGLGLGLHYKFGD